MEYYTYAYLDPRKPGNYHYPTLDLCFLYEPYYIGKGYKNEKNGLLRSCRWKCHQHKYSPKLNKTRKIVRLGLQPFIVEFKSELTEEQAFSYEIETIKVIGRFNLGTGPLLNLTDGGQGTSNPDPIMLKKRNKAISEGNKGIRIGWVLPDTHRKGIAQGLKRTFDKRRNARSTDLPLDTMTLFKLNREIRKSTRIKLNRRKRRRVGFGQQVSGEKNGMHGKGYKVSGKKNGMYGTSRTGEENPRAKFYYVLQSPSEQQYFVKRGCINLICKELNLNLAGIQYSAQQFAEFGSFYTIRKGLSKGWVAVRFEDPSNNPLRLGNQQPMPLNEEGSTTIESATKEVVFA